MTISLLFGCTLNLNQRDWPCVSMYWSTEAESGVPLSVNGTSVTGYAFGQAVLPGPAVAHCENSDVLPPKSMAVALTNWPMEVAATVEVK